MKGETDWLCDGAGEPDAFERSVEESLRVARWEGDVEGFVARVEREATGVEGGAEGALSHAARGGGNDQTPRSLGWRRPALLAAAGLVLIAGAWGVLVRGGGSAWERSSGAAWRVGRWIETGAGERVQVASDIGRVTVGPGSRVRLVRAGAEEHRMELLEGSIEAFIYAPPRLFFVETPGATAVDMGCAYELDVAGDGGGLLRVTGGWVELEGRVGLGVEGAGRASRVPAGAVCRIGADGGPGVPRFEDAAAGFDEAVDGVERGEAGALARALSLARARDGLTLWHLVGRTVGADRSAVVNRLAVLVPAEGVSEGALVLDASSMEAWWAEVRQRW